MADQNKILFYYGMIMGIIAILFAINPTARCTVTDYQVKNLCENEESGRVCYQSELTYLSGSSRKHTRTETEMHSYNPINDYKIGDKFMCYYDSDNQILKRSWYAYLAVMLLVGFIVWFILLFVFNIE